MFYQLLSSSGIETLRIIPRIWIPRKCQRSTVNTPYNVMGLRIIESVYMNKTMLFLTLLELSWVSAGTKSTWQCTLPKQNKATWH